MLQISSGIYFASDDLYETVHRRVFYTNGVRYRVADIALPIGLLRFTDGHGDVQPVIVEATDRLEKTLSDGSEAVHVATGGDELIADVADVVAFGLDIVMLPDIDLAQRVVAGAAMGTRRREKRLRHVLEPARFISDDEIDEFRVFCNELLALQRGHFEAAMRAIRRVADAITLAGTDVTLSYTLFVAALESLAQDASAPQSTWQNYDFAKRKIIDAACIDLAADQTEKVRNAVLEIDMLGLRRKFQGFVLDHISPEFYRGGATDSAKPIRAVELPKALDFAYQVRSKTVHELRDLAPELSELTQQDDTIWHDHKTVLGLEGLHRLCQHVIRQYVKRAPTGIDPDFQRTYRSAIPGTVRVRLDPEAWLPSYSNFTAIDAPQIFSGLVDSFHRVVTGQSEGVVDIRIPLQRIEALLPGESKDQSRLPMIAIYLLWHGMVATELERPEPGRYLDRDAHLLDLPSMYSYAIWLFGMEATWQDDELMMLADERETVLQQQHKSLLELPARLDATLRFDLARRAWNRGDEPECTKQLGKAIELLPGDQELIAYEADLINAKAFPASDPRVFFFNRSQQENAENEDASTSG